MQQYLPTQVYTNLIKLMEYRGVKLSAEPLSNVAVAQILNLNEYLIINGDRPKTDIRGQATVIVVLIAPKSKYSSKSGDFQKIIKTLPRIGATPVDLIIVSHPQLSRTVVKLVTAFHHDNPMVTVEYHDYELFGMEIPKHVSVPAHSIATQEEVREYCDHFYSSPEFFPKILHTDPQAIWLGARPGMVVKVARLSETAGITHIYRYCV
jgi:DNA-directed RNA polymerase subunit H (RpoH/RPB5)